MEEKLSAKAIDQYSNFFASKLADSFFSKKEKISGPEILSLCEIKQVNLLVIKELMRIWNSENEKWSSPYFNYEALEVQQSMSQFKNALSNNILISKKDFLPLLKAAAAQTLFLVLAPYDFFSNVLDRKGNEIIRAEELKTETRYLKINQSPFEKLVEKLELRQAEVITGNEAFGMLDHILEELNFTPEDVDGYIAAFSKVTPLNVAELFELVDAPVNATNTQPQVKEKPQPAIIDEPTDKIKFKIKDHLTINQKFMFTKMLFAGDFEIFSQTIDELDNYQTMKQAINYINENYPHWDRESDEYEELVAMLQRKFT